MLVASCVVAYSKFLCQTTVVCLRTFHQLCIGTCLFNRLPLGGIQRSKIGRFGGSPQDNPSRFAGLGTRGRQISLATVWVCAHGPVRFPFCLRRLILRRIRRGSCLSRSRSRSLSRPGAVQCDPAGQEYCCEYDSQRKKSRWCVHQPQEGAGHSRGRGGRRSGGSAFAIGVGGDATGGRTGRGAARQSQVRVIFLPFAGVQQDRLGLGQILESLSSNVF